MPGFTCAVPGCFNNSMKDKHLSFHKFPKDAVLRKQWLIKIKRQGKEGKYSEFKPTDGHRICSNHFDGGKKTYLNRIPTIFPLQKVKQAKQRSTSCSQQAPLNLSVRESQKESSSQKSQQENSITYDLSDHSYGLQCEKSDCVALEKMLKEKTAIIENIDSEVQDLRNQMDISKQTISKLKCELNKLARQNTVLIQQKQFMGAKAISKIRDVRKKMLSVETLKARNDMLQFYTGLQDYSEFQMLYNFIQEDIETMTHLGHPKPQGGKNRKRILTPETSLLILLIRLKSGLLEKDLAYRFHVSVTTISRVCRTYLDLLHRRLPHITVDPNRPKLIQAINHILQKGSLESKQVGS